MTCKYRVRQTDTARPLAHNGGSERFKELVPLGSILAALQPSSQFPATLAAQPYRVPEHKTASFNSVLLLASVALVHFDGENPFPVMTQRFDPVAHVVSVVTLAGHPLAGWRYWRVYSVGTNDVVIETDAYDQPGPGGSNYAGYFISSRVQREGWKYYLQYIQTRLQAKQGIRFQRSLGGLQDGVNVPLTQLRSFPLLNGPLLEGYWDYYGDFTTYILNNACPSTVCN